MSSATVFWLVFVGNLGIAVAVFFTVGLVLFLGLLMIFATEDMLEEYKNYFKGWGIVLGVVGLLGCFIPSQAQLAAIYLIPKITQSTQVKDISNASVNALESYLVTYLKSGDFKESECKN